MPTIGSVSGTFGHGRSPQNAPQPGFTIFPPIGRTTSWSFTANGAFEFEANTVTSTLGNCFVITPTTTFIANIAAWGAGGTSSTLSFINSRTNIAGAGGAVQGTFMFQGGQPYTLFVSGTGIEYVNGGSGGGSSGIFEGNVFQLAAGPGGTLSDVFTDVGSGGRQYQVEFNGTNQYLTTPSTENYNLSTEDWTVECWVYVNANGNNTILTSGSGGSSARNLWQINANRSLTWQTNPAGNWTWANTYASAADVIPLTTWTHIAAVRNGSNFSMYVNGVSVYSTNSFNGAGTSGTLFIGTYYANVNNDGSYFRGAISNFRIVKGTAVYTGAFNTPTVALTAIPNTVLLICNSATFTDLSTNAVTITPVGSPVISIGTLALTTASPPTAGNSPYVAIASGGGGGAQQMFRLAGAGGDSVFPQYGTVTVTSQNLFLPTGAGQHGYLVGQPGQTGLPERFNTWFTGGRQSTGTLAGGGGPNGATESGGIGHARIADTNETRLEAVGGNYSIAALYDHNRRGTAGDADHGGRISIYMDQYQITNMVATGGTVTDVPIPGHELAYRYHTFDTSGTFVVNSAAVTDTVDIFAVGGGGGGLELLPTNTVGAGGGGGGVALRIGCSITPGTYNVDVGGGGIKSDQYAGTGVGRIHGGYRGGDSAFYVNQLAARSFPDSYWRLLNSFGAPIRYISLSGDDTDGRTQATAYTSFRSALAKNDNNFELMVFAVIGGTYTAEIPANSEQSPIIDGNRPRVFVCAPGKVTINFTPANASGLRSSPMAILQHPLSAVYGAIFVRTMFESTRLEETAFFNDDTEPGDRRCLGSFYNCVFRENSNFWTFAWAFRTRSIQFRIENCTFFVRNAPQESTTTADLTLVRNSVFNRPVTTNAVLDNTVTNQTVTTKYVATGVTDKGVFSGPYNWDGAITVPARTAQTVMIVAQGGGGAQQKQDYLTPDLLGGSGGGFTGPGMNPSTQYNKQLNTDYSSYGFPALRGRAGGGAGYPGDSLESSPRAGIGIEWPRGSGVYYGTGGDTAVESIVQVAPGTVGKGGNGSGADGSPASNGNTGIVAVRYVVPGPYTPPAVARPDRNLIAYGGIITSTATYRQHVFTSSDRFVMMNRPEITLEVLIVGGGGGGAGSYFSFDRAFGGDGGGVVYNQIAVRKDGFGPTPTSNSLAVFVGAAGSRGQNSSNDNLRHGTSGGNSSITGSFGINLIGRGGNGGNPYVDFGVSPGIVVTNGLFSDNNQAYGADGGHSGRGWPYNEPGVPNPANWGGYGSGGRSGAPGIQGVVIIRYPIYPAN